MQPRQFGLVVEGIDLAEPAAEADMDCAFRFGGMMRRRIFLFTWRGRGQHAVVRQQAGKRGAENGMSQCEIGVQFQRPAQCALSCCGATQSIEQIALHKICPGVAIVDGKRGLRLGTRFGGHFSHVGRPDGTTLQEGPGEQAVGLPIIGRNPDGAPT